MKNLHTQLPTNQSIYDWYMAGTDNDDEDKELINNFRRIMVKWLSKSYIFVAFYIYSTTGMCYYNSKYFILKS